jgi:hypothetical protein
MLLGHERNSSAVLTQIGAELTTPLAFLQHNCLYWVGIIFLRGGDGAKDGQKLVGGEQWKPWSKKEAGKEDVRVEDGKSWTEQENPGAEGAG